MPNTYQAILRNNQIEWSGDVPKNLPSAVRVQVTLLDDLSSTEKDDQGIRMAAALEKLVKSNALSAIGDAVAWERELRQDRSLPGRND